MWWHAVPRVSALDEVARGNGRAAHPSRAIAMLFSTIHRAEARLTGVPRAGAGRRERRDRDMRAAHGAGRTDRRGRTASSWRLEGQDRGGAGVLRPPCPRARSRLGATTPETPPRHPGPVPAVGRRDPHRCGAGHGNRRRTPLRRTRRRRDPGAGLRDDRRGWGSRAMPISISGAVLAAGLRIAHEEPPERSPIGDSPLVSDGQIVVGPRTTRPRWRSKRIDRPGAIERDVGDPQSGASARVDRGASPRRGRAFPPTGDVRRH